MEQFGFEVMVLKWYQFFKNNFLIISISTICGMAILYTYSSLKPENYKSNVVLYSSLVDVSIVQPMIEDLTNYVNNKSYSVLSDVFEIPLEKVQDINSLELIEIENENVNEPVNTNSILGDFDDYGDNCFIIELKVSNPGSLNEFNSGITNYLENNEFINKIKLIREESIKNIIVKIEAQISALELVQNRDRKDEKSNIVINNENSSVTTEMIQLIHAQSKYEEMLKMSSVEIIKPFSVPERPESNTLLFLAAGAVIGGFFGLAFTSLRKLNGMI